MEETGIELKDYFVILNLHKALLEAKFHLNPDNINVSSSPIIADICNKLVDVLKKMDEEKSEKNIGKWDEWRLLKNQSFYRDRAIINAKLNNRWNKMNNEEKEKTVKNLISPFIATEEELKSFIQQVDGCHSIYDV